MDTTTNETAVVHFTPSAEIWDKKYRLKDANGEAIDKTVADSWRRVAKDCAEVESSPESWEAVFFENMKEFKFLPAGRILSGAGTGRIVTLFNCYVMGTVPDSMPGIFDNLKEAALTMQQGGGIGYDFSTLRPKGAYVHSVGSDSSGPLSFMDVWNAMCKTIMSAGSRRGAMMGTMRCDHPDIEDFIEAKREKDRLRMFNLSVLVSDPFMEAVKKDTSWELVFGGKVYNTVPARELWNKIMRSTYDFAEPGVIFIDRINRMNNLHYCETISATNPCVTGDTLVMTATGWKRIDEMTVDGQDIVGGDGNVYPVRPAFVTGEKPVLTLTTKAGRELRLTANHLVATPTGDVAAGDLKTGDEIVVASAMEVLAEANGGNATVPQGVDTVETISLGGIETVYDLTEPVTNHFVANGIVVHNCGEQPLPPYGACLLGSVNLAVAVENPFADDAGINEAALAKTVEIAVRMMDNVIDVSNFPLPQQKEEAQNKRRIGLGITGLGDALTMCKARYGSEKSVALTRKWMAVIQRAAYMASVELAKEKGPFPLFDKEKYIEGEYIKTLPKDIREAIGKYGIRNSHLLSIAPTGTISFYANNVSGGLEPPFTWSYTRKVLQPDGTKKEMSVEDYAFWRYRQHKGVEEMDPQDLPEYFGSAQDLEPKDHLVIQAAIQEYVDSSISKTINCPEEIEFDAFKDIYHQGYEMGIKGCTTYRPNDITGAVLEMNKESDTRKEQGEEGSVTRFAGGPRIIYDKRPHEPLDATAYKIKWPDELDLSYFVTISHIEERGRYRPMEIFIASMNSDIDHWVDALARLVSAIFRMGGDVAYIPEVLKDIRDNRGGQFVQHLPGSTRTRQMPSIIAAIGHVIEYHLKRIGYLDDDEDGDGAANVTPIGNTVTLTQPTPQAIAGMRSCPKCGEQALIRAEGCDRCTQCDYSKCS